MFLVEIVQPTGGSGRPRDQGLFLDTFLTSDISLFQLKPTQALAVSVDHGSDSMV